MHLLPLLSHVFAAFPAFPPPGRYDLPWHEKLLGASFQNGQLILGKLSGGKLDDITVLMARVMQVTEEVPAGPAPVAEAESA